MELIPINFKTRTRAVQEGNNKGGMDERSCVGPLKAGIQHREGTGHLTIRKIPRPSINIGKVSFGHKQVLEPGIMRICSGNREGTNQ